MTRESHFSQSFSNNINTFWLQYSVLKLQNNLQLWNPAYNNHEEEVPVCSSSAQPSVNNPALGCTLVLEWFIYVLPASGEKTQL